MRQQTGQRRQAFGLSAWRRWVVGLGVVLSITCAFGCCSTLLGVTFEVVAAYTRSHP